MEREKVKTVIRHPLLDNDVPSAPTLEDFHLDARDSCRAEVPPPHQLVQDHFTSQDTHTAQESSVGLAPDPSCPPAELEGSAPPLELTDETSFSTVTTSDCSGISAVTQDTVALRRLSECGGQPRNSSQQSSLQTMSPHQVLQSSLREMSPHQVLQSRLQEMSPHQVLQSSLQEMVRREQECQNTLREVSAAAGDLAADEEVTIVPFTDSQLHALYRNAELEKNLEFVEHWLETQVDIEKFPLDELLVNYLRVRTHLITCRRSYDRGRSRVDELVKELWQFSTERVEEEGDCEDGNTVVIAREAKVASFNEAAGQSLRSQLKECKEILTENHSLFSFRSEVLRLKIEEFLHSVVARSQGHHVERVLVYSSEQEVRLSISVLFKFLRKDIEDPRMVRDLRGWLDRLVSVVLAQPAVLYDHLFILNHMMRCPAGVGRWAAQYIQPSVPVTDLEETSFDNPFLDHLITILATILLPVKERRRFVHEFQMRGKRSVGDGEQEGVESDKVWVHLDGEGSEDEDPEECWAELRESDLIALFNQIPVDHMFRYVLRVEERDGSDQYDVGHSTQHSFLKLYAFSSQFVYLLREGLKTFNTPKYRQFAKRLGRLIRHTVHYVSDHWQGFRAKNIETLDPPMLLRLQVEYDNFFLRAAQCIFSSQKLGTWQFLADIPFATISASMLWRIFYVLHLDYHEESHKGFAEDIEDWSEALASPDLQLQFEEKCSEAGETEVYFLLSAFANMAMSRGPEDKVFIERATLDLFDVGFVCESTRDTCSKNCRDLLSSVCTTHPFLLSTLLQVMSDRVTQIGRLSGYLFQELPWRLWRPWQSEMKQVFDWLQMPAVSIESHLARTIISAMDWEHGELTTKLHVSTAIHIVETNAKFNPDSGVANSSMVTMTNLALVSMTTLAATEAQFTTWAWETVSRLHLHMIDRGPTEAQALLAGDQNLFAEVLDYDLNNQVEGIVAAAVVKHPLACYASLLLTQLGHSLPEVLERGLALLKVVQEAGRLDHVLELLLYITPLFLNDPTSIEDEKFRTVVIKLLAADQTYLSLAKSMITGAFPGPVTRELANMVEKSIAMHSKLGHSSPRQIINLWTKILTSLPGWNNNNSALFLLDKLLSHAFQIPAIHGDVLELVQDLHRKYLCDVNSGGLINWITGINYSGLKLLFTTSTPLFPGLAYFFLQAEELHCRQTGLWAALVSQLGQNKPLEEALAAASEKCEISQPPLSAQLPLYRWLQQALDTAPGHPLNVIFWQRFFQLFLSRPQPGGQGEETRGVGMCFFQGMLNNLYLNKVKTALRSVQEYHAKTLSGESDGEKKLGDKLVKMFKTFYMWLDEAKILDSTLYIPALSPVYEPEKLARMLAGDTTLWLEFVNMESSVAEHQHAVSEWDRLHFRHQKAGTGEHLRKLSEKAALTPAERILKRLQSYEPRLLAPVFRSQDPPIPFLPLSTLTSAESLTLALSSPLALLSEMSGQFSSNSLAYGSLNCSYLELAPSLWEEEDVEVFVKQTCPGVQQGKQKFDCCGPAMIQLQYSEAKIQEVVGCRLEANRKEWDVTETRLLAAPSQKFVVAAALLNDISHRLLMLYEKDLGKGQVYSSNHALGLVLFYEVARTVTEDWLACPSLRHFVSDYLETLASVVVSGTQGQAPHLLQVLVKCPHLSPFLSSHFSPNIQDHQEVVQVYKNLCGLVDGDGALPFVLLSKLDIPGWLQLCPQVQDRSQVIQIIGKALAKTGHDPEQSREMLHGLHRRHLFQLFSGGRTTHYMEVLDMLLAITELSQLDPAVWVDLLNCLTNSPGKFSLEYQDRDERLACISEYINFVAQDVNLQETNNVLAKLTDHFSKERLQFGLYGLYPKYRSYVEPLTAYFSFLGNQFIQELVRRDQGIISALHLDEVFSTLEGLYGPWIFPLNPAARPSTANWIQQLTDEKTCLPPWIPGDSSFAAAHVSSFLHCVARLLTEQSDPRTTSGTLSRLWKMYSKHWAQPGVKDHVLGVVHSALTALPWTRMMPSQQDIDLMVKVMSSFVPVCHAFLGSIFVQIDWQTVTEMPVEHNHLLPALLCLLVKLGAEPSVRQNGSILGHLSSAMTWTWASVDLAQYEALAQWFVMSIDCRCVVKHPERSSVDDAVIRLFRAAAGFSLTGDQGETHSSVEKQKVWVKCLARLLTTCGSKQRNFLSYNQPALHTTLRKLLEDISLISSVDKHTSTFLVKNFLTILNSSSSSVLPGSALMVLQSWLTNQSNKSTLLHSFLNQAVMAVNEPKMASSVMESVLETCFKEATEDEEEPRWGLILDHISWPSGTRIQQVLDQAVSAGHLLLLHAYISYRRPSCISLYEEKMLATSSLDWLRHLASQQISSLGVEPKLSLLYRQVIVLLQRQAAYSDQGGSQAWLSSTLGQLCDVLLAFADSSPGWGQNLLGAIGLASNNAISLKGKFLARSLYLYIRVLMSLDKTCLLERSLDEESVETREKVLASQEVKPHLDKIVSLKTNKAFAGIHDLVDWTITQIRDETNTLMDAHIFLDKIVVNRLYIDLYLKP